MIPLPRVILQTNPTKPRWFRNIHGEQSGSVEGRYEFDGKGMEIDLSSTDVTEQSGQVGTCQSQGEGGGMFSEAPLRGWSQRHAIITGRDGPLRRFHDGVGTIASDLGGQRRTLAAPLGIRCENDQAPAHRLTLKSHYAADARRLALRWTRRRAASPIAPQPHEDAIADQPLQPAAISSWALSLPPLHVPTYRLLVRARLTAIRFYEFSM